MEKAMIKEGKVFCLFFLCDSLPFSRTTTVVAACFPAHRRKKMVGDDAAGWQSHFHYREGHEHDPNDKSAGLFLHRVMNHPKSLFLLRVRGAHARYLPRHKWMGCHFP
jgi:hypothetical protein